MSSVFDRSWSDLIMGLDPGTTGLKLAMTKVRKVWGDDGKLTSVQDNPHEPPIMLQDFPSSSNNELTATPTALIYDYNGKLFKWGHIGSEFQKEDAFDPKYLVTNWKPALSKSSRGKCQDVNAKAQFLRKVPRDFADDFFCALGQYLFKDDDSCLLGHFGGDIKRFKYVDCVIAVPPGWSRDEHLVFTRAATKGLRNIPNLRVFAVSETECALMTWMSLEGNDLMRDSGKSGDIIILVDMGGGTACVSAFRWLNNKWAHMESQSLAVGSEISTELFLRDFQRRLHGVQLATGLSRLLYEAKAAFDQNKRKVGGDTEAEYWRCPVWGLMPDREKRFENNYMIFTRAEIRGYFEPSLDEILAVIADVVSRVTRTHSKPKYLVIAGGYGTNLLFRRKMRISHKNFGMRVFLPQKRGDLVVTGACQTRIQGEFCRLTGSRYSAAILIWLEYEEEVRRKNPDVHTFLVGKDKKTYCRALEWIIKKGDRLSEDNDVVSDKRKRYFESEESFKINECMYTSEEHPGEGKHTVLKYGTDARGWKQNESELYNMKLTCNEFSLNLSSLRLLENNRSERTLANSVLKRDGPGPFFEYTYFLHLSQTDCNLAIEVFSKRGKSERVELQQSISAFDVGSTLLEGEYEFVESQRSNVDPEQDFETALSHGNISASGDITSSLEIYETRSNGCTSIPISDGSPNVTARNEGSSSHPAILNMASLVKEEVSYGQDVTSAEISDADGSKRSGRYHPPSAKYAAPTVASADHSGFGDDSDDSEFVRSSMKPSPRKTAVQSLKVPVTKASMVSKSGIKKRSTKSASMRRSLG